MVRPVDLYAILIPVVFGRFSADFLRFREIAAGGG